ncbi:D-alanyl-D-alanine carboxypeptidase [Neorhizobium galegae]|uniref:D-alanyl-D-alanine carboxypeptidase family protein n=1 Tax=Neorhizobium galegae TaxID=399 RepID=UPI0024784DDF|nr:D-alanyl-D-alanine carboxypeptidase family protein [Neorhizobium galegae]MBP2550251.1 D-alanyl-D-alanine carboxypeptidase [Neorhizobium galegae]
MLSSLNRSPAVSRSCAALAAAVLALGAFSTPASANPKMVVDVRSGQVFAHQEAFRKWYPASLTKLMTVYVTFKTLKEGRLSLETPVVMSRKAVDQPASKMYLKPGATMSLDSALKILMVKSANDVAVGVAETVGGSTDQFVAMMNAEAARLGMSSSHFINPHGLPGKGQFTTARDLAVLAVQLRRQFPEYASYFALEGITTGAKDYPNYNMLIGRFEGADGMKTGFICASGFNQVSSATRNGRTLVSVVLGSDSLAGRSDESADLLQAAFTGAQTPSGTLSSLAPYGPDRDAVVDVSAEICNPKAAKVRSEGRDEAGRMVLHSPYIKEMTRPPAFSLADITNPAAPVEAAASKAGTGQAAAGQILNVPLPIPRPTF